MNYPDNPDLLAAVIADAEDDAPRLVYADWLDDHGDPHRAEFIRVQCGLAAGSPADPDYADLLERKAEVLPRMWGRRLGPSAPEGISFHDNPYEERDDSTARYHRGFPSFASEPHFDDLPDPADIRRFRDALPEMIATTTLRGLRFYGVFSQNLHVILDSPAADRLSALAVDNVPADASRPVGTVGAIIASPCIHNLRWLELRSLHGSADAVALACAKGFGQLRRLDIPWPNCFPAALARIMEAEWFGRLRRVWFNLHADNAATAAAGLAKLPDLHTLESYDFAAEGAAAFSTAGRFPALGRLFLRSTRLRDGAAALARADMPRLAALQLVGSGLCNDDVAALSRSGLFAGLRILSLEGNEIGDKGVASLAASPAAGLLRSLGLGDNKFGKAGLGVLLRPNAFSSLTRLDLRSSLKRKASAEEVTRFLTRWASPRLRHLDLSGWPIDDSGAKALAANPAFANLTCLGLAYCQVGPEGAAALFDSPHLRRLVKLELTHNPVGKGAEALLDPDVLPELAECWLPAGVPEPLKERLGAARGTTFLG
jgi:uncharacterized protein (TIGR02996 family)